MWKNQNKIMDKKTIIFNFQIINREALLFNYTIIFYFLIYINLKILNSLTTRIILTATGSKLVRIKFRDLR